MQAFKIRRQTIILPSYDAYESEQGQEWHNNHKAA